MSRDTKPCWRGIGVYGGDHSCPRLLEEIHCRNCDVFRQAARGLLSRRIEPLPPLSGLLQAQAKEASISVLCFRLGSDWLALGCERVAEVAEARIPRRIAHRCQSRFEGLVPVRGELHLCVALIELLQLGARKELSGERARLILLQPAQAAPIAFRANEVIGLRRIRSADIEEVPATLAPELKRCVKGVAAFERGRLAILDDSALIEILGEALFA